MSTKLKPTLGFWTTSWETLYWSPFIFFSSFTETNHLMLLFYLLFTWSSTLHPTRYTVWIFTIQAHFLSCPWLSLSPGPAWTSGRWPRWPSRSLETSPPGSRSSRGRRCAAGARSERSPSALTLRWNGAPASARRSLVVVCWFMCRLTFQGEVEPEAELGVGREGGADQPVGVVRVRLQLGLSQQERSWQEKATLFHCSAEA